MFAQLSLGPAGDTGTCWNKMFNGGRCVSLNALQPKYAREWPGRCAPHARRMHARGSRAVGLSDTLAGECSCPHLRNAAIYKKSLKKINQLHYQ